MDIDPVVMEEEWETHVFDADAHQSDGGAPVRSQRLPVFGPHQSRRWIPSKFIIHLLFFSISF